MNRTFTAVVTALFLVAAVALAGGPTAKVTSNGTPSKLDIAANPPALPIAGDASERGCTRALDDLTMYAEDFEHTLSGDLPSGWQRIDQDGGFCNQWNRNSLFQVFAYGRENAHSGTKIAMINYNDGGVPNNDWLVMPQLTAGAGLHFHYYSASQDPAFLESYEVRVSTTGVDPADFTTVVETVDNAAAVWTRHTIELPAFANQSIYVAFHCTSVDRFVLKLDDFEVSTDDGGPTGSMAGVIRRAVNDTVATNLANAVVTVDGLGYQATTALDGSYRIDFVPAGVHSISVVGPSLVGGVRYQPGSLAGINIVAGTVTESTNLILNRLNLDSQLFPFSGNGLFISDLDTTAWAINVRDTVHSVFELNVLVNIVHSWDGDLDLFLRAPNGVTVQLYRHNINIWGNDFQSTLFSDRADQYVFFATPPYADTLRPLNPLSAFSGIPMRGNWTLLIYDNYPEDGGGIDDWTLDISWVTPSVTEGAADPGPAAQNFHFVGNYPNPFNASTDFAFELARQSRVTLKLYNLVGQQVATLVDGMAAAGSHTVHFDATDLASGIYIAQLQTGGASVSRKVVLLK